MRKRIQKLVVQMIEKELVVVLAIVMLLGILFGYSLAAGKNTEPSAFDLSPTVGNSLMRAELGAGEVD